ncbi:MAG: response regulator [Streptomycetaceae bacterium]|nr:response regulator [Streptomycetaceae bacterium]NUS54167.1 response regulator [Streptomycetaceae bacterium]
MSALVPRRPYDILLVEDDAADALLIEEALRQVAERRVVQAEDGVAALEHLRDRSTPPPDLILLDLNMPRMNGRELLAVLKNDEDLRAIPVVVLTTSGAPQDVSDAYRNHTNAYITKPIDLDAFTEAVHGIDAFFFRTATLPTRPPA